MPEEQKEDQLGSHDEKVLKTKCTRMFDFLTKKKKNYNHGPKEILSSSSDEERPTNVEKKKKKRLKDKIKEKISGKKDIENSEHVEKSDGIVGKVIEKMKGKLNGKCKKANDNRIIHDKISNDKLPVKHNKQEDDK